MVVLGRYVTLIACLFICLHGHGQTMEAIKASSGYYWAEGIGLTLDEADNNALSQISRQIAVASLRNLRKRITQNWEMMEVFCLIMSKKDS